MNDSSGEYSLRAAVAGYIMRHYDDILDRAAPGTEPEGKKLSSINDIIITRTSSSPEGSYSFMTDFRTRDLDVTVTGTMNAKGEFSVTRLEAKRV